jgi:hypothetical protein
MGGGARSGRAERAKVRQDPYKYEIIFRVFDEKGKLVLEKPKDPDVVVEP